MQTPRLICITGGNFEDLGYSYKYTNHDISNCWYFDDQSEPPISLI